MEQKNFRHELEDVPTLHKNGPDYNIEEVISVNQQIRNVK